MKCPNCGAEIKSTNFCEYCGSQITVDMRKEQEALDKLLCPKCGSSNVTYYRENQGEVREKNSKHFIYKTVGLCKDCGNTWFTNSEQPKQRKTWLWVLGWIFIFPVPLTILLLRKKDMNAILKYGLIALAWIVYLIIGFSGGGNSTDTKKTTTDNSTSITYNVETTQETNEQETIENGTP